MAGLAARLRDVRNGGTIGARTIGEGPSETE
jgi:hypothetical protein